MNGAREDRMRRALAQSLTDLGMTTTDAFVAYLALGGDGDWSAFHDMVVGPGPVHRRDFDTLAAALNDRHTEMGNDHPIPESGMFDL